MGFCTQCTIGRRENDFYPDTISSDNSGQYGLGNNNGDLWDWWVLNYYVLNGTFYWWTTVYRHEITIPGQFQYGIVNTKNWAWGSNEFLLTKNGIYCSMQEVR